MTTSNHIDHGDLGEHVKHKVNAKLTACYVLHVIV